MENLMTKIVVLEYTGGNNPAFKGQTFAITLAELKMRLRDARFNRAKSETVRRCDEAGGILGITLQTLCDTVPGFKEQFNNNIRHALGDDFPGIRLNFYQQQ
jgi:hypothetical protein